MPCHRSPWGIACAYVTQAALPAQVPAHATLLNPTTLQSQPTFVQQGDVVNAFSRGSTTIFHARSIDGGRTWAWREQPLGPFQNAHPVDTFAKVEVLARGAELLVVGDDQNQGPRFVRSLDAGATWLPPVAVAASAVPQVFDMLPSLHADGANLFVAWTNDRPTGRVFCNRSFDNGATWQPSDTPLDLGVVAPGVGIHFLWVVGSGPTVHVFWNQGGARYQRSLDGGTTWLPQPVDLTQAIAGEFVAVAGDGNVLLAASGNGWLLRSANAGVSWLLATNHGVPWVQDIAILGQFVVIGGWNGLPVQPVFTMNASSDGGFHWRPNPPMLPSPSFAVLPRAIAKPGELFVRWQIPGYPGGAVRTLDAGLTWQVIDGPMQGGFEPSDVRTLQAESTALATGAPFHYAYVGVGSSRLGASTTGTGGIAPRLTSQGLPVRGGATTLRGEGTVGGSLAALALSLQAPAAFPFGSATVHLASLDVLFGLPTSGAGGQAGAGAFALPVAIPNNPALVGVRLVAQALVVDGGALDGFTVTNALEIWLR